MSFQPLSRLCVLRLTQLLELNCLEGLQQLEDSKHVAENIVIENNYNDVTPSSKSPRSQMKKVLKNIPHKDMPSTFGFSITESTLLMIIQFIDHLKLHASTEGLFRISGNKKRQEELKIILSKNEKLDLEDEGCPYNAHDIAGILKLFFSGLPEPLLTKSCFICYQQLAGKLKDMDSNLRHKKKVDTLKMLFLLLPPLNRLLLKELIHLLAVVAADETNKMTAYNLGVIFAPNIVCTRQPMGCLSDFTENMEPFTDLVKFIIENTTEVFEVPDDFIEEGKQYTKQVTANQSNDVEVPMTKTYCQQIDSKQFAKESKDNTHQELMLLYSQMVDLPDGPLKRDFMEKFRQSYPGTPMFIPKSVKEKQKEMQTPSTPQSRSKFGGCLNRNAVKKAASENFLDTMEKDVDIIPGPSSRFGTPGRSEDNILAAYSNSHILSSTGTPGRMKRICKRLRRRSVEIFKGVKDTKATASTDDLSDNIEKENQNASSMKSLFRSYRKPTGTWKGLKKSISTPTLSSRRKSNTSSDETDDEFGKRKLSFSGEAKENKITKETETKPCVYDHGFVNNAFAEHPDTPAKAQTPIIRKALCPTVVLRSENIKQSSEEKSTTLQNIENTPKILKPRSHSNQVTNGKSKQKSVKGSGHVKKLTALPNKSVATSNDTGSKPTSKSSNILHKIGRRSSRSNVNKENLSTSK